MRNKKLSAKSNDAEYVLLAADLSLRRPGFAKFRVNPGKESYEQLMVCDLDKRKHKGSHGAILQAIYDKICELAGDADVFVREQGFSRFSQGTQTLFKVVGVADLAAWQTRQGIFHEIPPTIVKKMITGKGNASKEEVAAGLVRFVGEREYASDDQSDAVAVGVAQLLKSSGTNAKSKE